MSKPFVRNPYNYDTNEAGDESGLKCEDEPRTKQSFKEECDINTIVERFGLTGELPQNVRAPEYRDFTSAVDYHTALNAIAQANEAFDQMPANVRARFHNDPGEFVDFVNDNNNREEAKKLGLLVPEAMQQPLTGMLAMGTFPMDEETEKDQSPQGDRKKETPKKEKGVT